MGTCCTNESDYLSLLDSYFSRLPIRHISSIEVNNDIYKVSTIDNKYLNKLTKNIKTQINYNLDNNKYFKNKSNNKNTKTTNIDTQKIFMEEEPNRFLHDTNFEKLIHKYFIVKDYEKESFSYAFDVFKSINYNRSYPVIKFILLMLSGFDSIDNSEELLGYSLSYANYYFYTIDESEVLDHSSNNLNNSRLENVISYKNGKGIKNEYLLYLIYCYLKSITILTINPLMKNLLSKNYNDKLKEYYNSLWLEDYYEIYIFEHFKFDNKFNSLRNIEKFIAEFLHSLNPIELRLSFTEYCLERQRLSKREDTIKIRYYGN